MTKHTPGPWLEDHTAEPEVMAQALLDNPSWVAVEDTSENGGHVAYCAPANASLIADAPAMLAVLRAWVESTTLADEAGSMRPVYLAARALIAKHMELNQ
jgi:hypothetical protein